MGNAMAHIKPTPEGTKRAQLVALLERKEGASLDDMVAATDWLPHTVRAALTGLRKSGYAIESQRADGMRQYRIVTPAQ